MNRRTSLNLAAAPLALCTVLLASPALAQDEAPVVVAPEDEAQEAAPADDGVIFVTGSRIRARRDDFNSPAPLTVINPDIAARQGLNSTAEMIQGSPISAGSAQVTSAISSNFLTNGGAGAQTVSLRGLGAERTLVLLNGRRAGPAGVRGSVSSFDLNVLPQSIVGQVDLLKDGASSIYGSDAVAGVVNIITKRDTDGVEFDFFGSAPLESGGEDWSASATWGKVFDRGHVLVAGSVQRQNELARRDRDYLGCTELYGFTDETYTTRADLIDPRTGTTACNAESDSTWGHVWTYDYSYYYGVDSNLPQQSPGNQTGDGDVYLIQYDYDGNLGQFIPTIPGVTVPGQIGIPEGWFITGIDPASEAVQNNFHPRRYNDTIIPATNLYTGYVDAAFELTDFAELYFEGLINRRETYVNQSGQVYVFGNGEYLFEPGEDEGVFGAPNDPLAVGWSGAARFSPTGFTDYLDASVEVDYLRSVVGVRGDVSSAWSYDIYGQYSRSSGTYRNQTPLNDALAVASDRSGSCEGTVVSEGTPLERDCVDIDWYSPRIMFGDYTAEEYDFLFAWDEGNTEFTQKYAEAIISGDLIDLPWSGMVGIVGGASIREDVINDTPGYIQLENQGFSLVGAGITAGKAITKEAFGEIKIPLLADMPGFRQLDFSGAARVTNVDATRASDGFSSASNGNWTYKLGLNWQVDDLLRLRATYGTSYRAPALFEQFLADQVAGLRSWRDPCGNLQANLDNGDITQLRYDNCVADGIPVTGFTGGGIQPSTITGGGIGVLDPETSRAYTISAIVTPKFTFLPDTNFSVAFDYFDIEVNGQIAQLSAPGIVFGCYDSVFFENEPLCDQFDRVRDLEPGDVGYNDGPGNNVGVIRNSFLNINSQQNTGLDLTARIIHDFPGSTTLTLQGLMTWQFEDKQALFEGTEEDFNGLSGEPVWTGDFNVQLDTDVWNFFYGLDVVGGTDNTEYYLERAGSICQDFVTYDTPVCAQLKAPARFYHSFSVSRDIGDHLGLTLGIANVFGTKPPRISELGGTGAAVLGQGVLTSQYDLRGTRVFARMLLNY